MAERVIVERPRVARVTNTVDKPEEKLLANIKQKPYFAKTNFALYHGDSIKLLAQLPDNSIDMIFADPPYNLSNGGFTVHAGWQVSFNKGKETRVMD